MSQIIENVQQRMNSMSNMAVWGDKSSFEGKIATMTRK